MQPATMIKSIRFLASGRFCRHICFGVSRNSTLKCRKCISKSEDSEPAARWLALMLYETNHYHDDDDSSSRGHNSSKDSKSNSLFNKHSLKVVKKSLKTNSTLLKTCNCSSTTRRLRKLSDPSSSLLTHFREDDLRSIADEFPCSNYGLSYHLISSKQMVGIFLSVWARKELAHHIGHLRVSFS
ncbi:hypothetical protein HAX54_007641 [Datura stramonium]|uniref:Uncharacterized protein n=1 Tax=Datura stramonium TaxID=4076 RepID=A0ABS8TDP5_DATST|nr:hypothetical protein [Datura stramonium]